MAQDLPKFECEVGYILGRRHLMDFHEPEPSGIIGLDRFHDCFILSVFSLSGFFLRAISSKLLKIRISPFTNLMPTGMTTICIPEGQPPAPTRMGSGGRDTLNCPDPLAYRRRPRPSTGRSSAMRDKLSVNLEEIAYYCERAP